MIKFGALIFLHFKMYKYRLVLNGTAISAEFLAEIQSLAVI
jgi:hypothetical protein